MRARYGFGHFRKGVVIDLAEGEFEVFCRSMMLSAWACSFAITVLGIVALCR